MSARIPLWLAFAFVQLSASQKPIVTHTTTVYNKTTAVIDIWWNSVDSTNFIGWAWHTESSVYQGWYCNPTNTYFVVIENRTLSRGQCAKTPSITSLNIDPCVETSRTVWPTPCPSDRTCTSMNIIESLSAKSSANYYECYNMGYEPTAYRTQPSPVTAESTTAPPLYAPPSATAESTTTPPLYAPPSATAESTTTPPPSSTNIPNPTPSSTSVSAIPPPTSSAPSPSLEATGDPSSSKPLLTKGEIAGIVVGSLTVIVGIIAWLCPHPALKRGMKYWLAGRFQKKKHEDIDELPLNRLNRLNRTRTF